MVIRSILIGSGLIAVSSLVANICIVFYRLGGEHARGLATVLNEVPPAQMPESQRIQRLMMIGIEQRLDRMYRIAWFILLIAGISAVVGLVTNDAVMTLISGLITLTSLSASYGHRMVRSV